MKTPSHILVLLLALVLSSRAPAAISDQTPTDNVLAFWQISLPARGATKPGGVCAPWLERSLTDHFVYSMSLVDQDRATHALGRVAARAACQGINQTGVALASAERPPLPPPPEKKEPEAAGSSGGPAGSPAKPGPAKPPASPATGNPEPIAPISASDPVDKPAVEKPKVETSPKSVVIDLTWSDDLGSPQAWLMQTLDVSGVDEEPVMVGERACRGIRGEGWARPLLWTRSGARLIVATDARAIEYAFAEAQPGADVIREDWQGQRKKVADSRPGARPFAAVMWNVNAMRHEYPAAFDVGGAGWRTLAAWRMLNVRTLTAHVGLMDGAKSQGMVASILPPLVMLDLTWSAKSDAPGTSMHAPLSSSLSPGRQTAVIPVDMQALLIARANPRSWMDWAFRTWLAQIDDEKEATEAAQSWSSWVGENRRPINEAGESLGQWAVLGFRGLDDPASPARLSWRMTTRVGTAREKLDALLLRIAKRAGAAESASTPGVVGVSVKCPWLDGSVLWTIAPGQGVPVVVGAIVLDQSDAAPWVKAASEDAKLVAPVRPAP